MTSKEILNDNDIRGFGEEMFFNPYNSRNKEIKQYDVEMIFEKNTALVRRFSILNYIKERLFTNHI